MSDNLLSLFKARYKTQLDAPCLAYPDGRSWTYGDIDRLTGQFAALLLQEGVTPGDRVVVQVEKSAAAVALYLACLQTGTLYVPLNTAYTANEVAFFLNDAKPRVFVCRPESAAAYTVIIQSAGVQQTLLLGQDESSPAWKAAMQLSPLESVVTRQGQDSACIIYTSGTTGRSKGAMLSHANLSSNAVSLHRIWGFRPGDVLLHALPIYHVHGLFVALHCALLNASKIIFMPGFNVDQIITALPQATVLMGVPTFYTRLLNSADFGRQHCAHMRLFISGSAPLAEKTHLEFEQRTGYKILERYGMTEAGMITSNPLDGERLAGTVGYPLPDVEVRVADSEGKPVAAGVTGNIEIRGPNVFSGYWGLPEKTAQDFRADGFFITGDVGVLTTDGRLTISGRSKDLIISGGYNVYPREVELCLDNITGISESAVIGLPHPDFGEAVTAILVKNDPALDESRIMQKLAEQLARYKQPKRIIFIDALPRNSMGKVQKNLLRERYRDTYTGSMIK
ncbi:MAG: matB [Gammaproteobacteria bacterium]|nr:matB [Gammaproteobacteria bacterium]